MKANTASTQKGCKCPLVTSSESILCLCCHLQKRLKSLAFHERSLSNTPLSESLMSSTEEGQDVSAPHVSIKPQQLRQSPPSHSGAMPSPHSIHGQVASHQSIHLQSMSQVVANCQCIVEGAVSEEHGFKLTIYFIHCLEISHVNKEDCRLDDLGEAAPCCCQDLTQVVQSLLGLLSRISGRQFGFLERPVRLKRFAACCSARTATHIRSTMFCSISCLAGFAKLFSANLSCKCKAHPRCEAKLARDK